MTRSTKASLSWFLTFSLLVSSLPATAQPPTSARLSDEAQEVFDLLISNKKKSETLSEMYYRIESRLPQEEKNGLAPLLKGQEKLQTPHMKMEGSTWVLSDQGQELRIEILEGPLLTRFKVNGVQLKDSEARDPKRRFEALQKIVQKGNPKTGQLWPMGPLMSLLLPEAHAFNWTNLLITAAVGLGAFFLGKHIGKNKARGRGSNCSVAGPVCCFANGVYQVYQGSGCCQDIGGFGTGYAVNACPVGSATGTTMGLPGAQQ